MNNRFFALLLGLVLCCGATASQAAWQLGDLMQALAQSKGGRASFVEKKYLAIVDKPVESSGELLYVAPDRLEKRTLKPRAESLVLEGQRLAIERAGKARLTLDLQSYPEAAAFVDSIRGTLAGDRGALEKVYRLTLSGDAAQWQLILIPQYSRMSDIVTRIVIRGSKGEVSRIDFDLADGDRSEMTITQVSGK